MSNIFLLDNVLYVMWSDLKHTECIYFKLT